MSSNMFFVLKIILGIIAAILAVITAWFGIKVPIDDKKKQQKYKDRLEYIYSKINILPWRRLPERVIIFVQKKVQLFFSSKMFSSNYFLIYALFAVILLSVLKITGTFEYTHISYIEKISLGVCFLILYSFKGVLRIVSFSLFGIYFFFRASLCFISAPIIISSIFYALSIPILAATIHWPLTLIYLLLHYRDKDIDNKISTNMFVPVSTCIASSYTLTCIALLLGSFIIPTSWVPQTKSMLLSNVLFDCLAVYFTTAMLKRAVQRSNKLSIPVAIPLIIMTTAIFACLSLWLGLYFTKNPITFRETVNVLFFRSFDGTHWNAGPCFWAMHTVFLPVLAYLSFILLCCLIKLIYKPIRHVFSLYRINKEANPYAITVAILTLLTTIFIALSTAAGYMEDISQKKEVPITTPVM